MVNKILANGSQQYPQMRYKPPDSTASSRLLCGTWAVKELIHTWCSCSFCAVNSKSCISDLRTTVWSTSIQSNRLWLLAWRVKNLKFLTVLDSFSLEDECSQTWLSERGKMMAVWSGLEDRTRLWVLNILTQVMGKDDRGRENKSPPVFYLLMNI